MSVGRGFRLYDGPDLKKNYSLDGLGRNFLMYVSRLLGAQLVVFLRSSNSVVLFDNPWGLQSSQHVVSVKYLPLLHYKLYL